MWHLHRRFRHFVCECQHKPTATFTKGAALSWKKASSSVASDHCCDHMLRDSTFSVADKMLLSINVHIRNKNSHSSDLFGKSVFTRVYQNHLSSRFPICKTGNKSVNKEKHGRILSFTIINI